MEIDKSPYSRLYSLASIIILPVVFSTGLIDSFVGYFAKIPFIPGTPPLLDYFYLSLPAPIICAAYVILLYKLNNKKLFLATGILIGPLCFGVSGEINISYLPTYFAAIPYESYSVF
jgi:hypothetical protein